MEWDWHNPVDKSGNPIQTGFYYYDGRRRVLYIERTESACIGEDEGGKFCPSSMTLLTCEPISHPCIRAKLMRLDADFIERKLVELGLEWRLKERE